MEFSVIIPVRNRAGEIRRCVAGVRAGVLAKEYEILVVDNGSTDATARAAEEAGARVICEPVPNRCRARNRGAAEARGRWLVFLDSDCIPAPDWLAELEKAIREIEGEDKDRLKAELRTGDHLKAERRAIVAGRIESAAPATAVEAYIERRRWIDQEKFLAGGGRFMPPFAATANLAVRRDVYLELGGLDPALAASGEDADFCWRAAKAGWGIRYAPGATVTHYHRATAQGLWRQAYFYGVGQADLFAKWRGEWGARAWVEPHLWVWALKGLLKSPVRWAMGRTPLERREPFYDFLANTAMALGRLRGGARHRVIVI